MDLVYQNHDQARPAKTTAPPKNSRYELARQGALSPSEEAELDGYLRVGDLIAILQSRARGLLRTQGL